jgi:type II secretory pathway pseudopilin PulG
MVTHERRRNIMQRRLFPRRRGITLVEVIVLTGVVVVLAGLLIPAIQRVRQAQTRSQSSNNLKQMSLGIANLSGNFFGKVPCGYGTFPGTNAVLGSPTTEAQSYFYWLLPFLEQDCVYKLSKYDFEHPVKTYIAPDDPTNPGDTADNSYCVNARVFGGCTGRGPVATYPGTFNLKGTSNVVTTFERYARLNGTWGGEAADNADGSCVLYGPHTDVGGAVKDPSFGLPDTDPRCTLTANGYTPLGIQVALADGSARTLAPAVTGSYAGTTIWGWAISITGPDEGLFGKAKPPAGW